MEGIPVEGKKLLQPVPRRAVDRIRLGDLLKFDYMHSERIYWRGLRGVKWAATLERQKQILINMKGATANSLPVEFWPDGGA